MERTFDWVGSAYGRVRLTYDGGRAFGPVAPAYGRVGQTSGPPHSQAWRLALLDLRLAGDWGLLALVHLKEPAVGGLRCVH